MIANQPFGYPKEMALLFLGFIVLYIVDETSQTLRIRGFSDTEYYRESVSGMKFEPSDYCPQLDDPRNLICKAIRDHKPQLTKDWATLTRPESDIEVARFNQANAGIGYSTICPLNGHTRGAIMFNYFQYPENSSKDQADFMSRYTQIASGCIDKLELTTV